MNSPRPSCGLFIAGSNTEVGKTTVACAIARSLVASGVRVGVYKPAASGAEQRDGWFVSTDAERLWEAAGRPLTLDAVCPQTFEAPLAPHLAARAEDKEIDSALLRAGADAWSAEDWDILLVEGAGGLLSPITDNDLIADLAMDLGYPVLLVVPNTLGVIGQTLQTIVAAHAFRRSLPQCVQRPSSTTDDTPLRVLGIIANQVQPPLERDASVESNLEQLRRWCVPPVLGELGYNSDTISPDVDWMELVRARCE